MPLPPPSATVQHQKLLPVYRGKKRYALMPGVLSLLTFGLIFTPSLLFGSGRVNLHLAAAVLALYIISMIVFAWHVHFRPVRRIMAAVTQADDIAHICTRCLYIAEPIGRGLPCPECGTAHHAGVVAEWWWTGLTIRKDKRIERALQASPSFNPPETTAYEAATAPPD